MSTELFRDIAPRVELPALPDEVAERILIGSWTLFRLPDGMFAVQTPRQNACCNKHEQQTWLCEADGKIVSRVSGLPEGATYVLLERR